MNKNIDPGCYDILVYAQCRKPVYEEVGLKLSVRQPGFGTLVFEAERVERLEGSDVIKLEAKAVTVVTPAELVVATHPDARAFVDVMEADLFEEISIEDIDIDLDI